MSDRRPATTRPRGRPRLSPERMVAAALRIVDEDGAEALTMRSLAQHLDSGTATLYRHFGSRSDLVAQVVDAVYAETGLAEEDLQRHPWPGVCRHIASTMFQTLARHPNIAPLLVDVPVGPHALVVRERCLAALLHHGLPPAAAARTFASLSRVAVGFGSQRRPSDDPATEGTTREVFAGLDARRFPATTAVAGRLPVSLDDEFTFALDLLVDGLQELTRRPRGGVAPI